MLKKIAERYFDLFCKKNIKQISEMFAEEIILKDPDITSIGKKEVLNTTKNIFHSVGTIEIKVNALYLENRTVVAEFDINIDNNKLTKVVDILQFDQANKIVRISAYIM